MTEMKEVSRQSGKSCWRWRSTNFQAGEKDHGAVALMLDLAKAVQISGRRERKWSSSLDVRLGEGCTNFRQERKIMEQ